MATDDTDDAHARRRDGRRSSREGLRGEVIAPGDPGYDEARAIWNGAIDRRPALIVRCAGVGRRHRARSSSPAARTSTLAVRGGGHSIPGFSTIDGGIVIDLVADERRPRRPGRAARGRQGGVHLGRRRPRDAGVRPGRHRRPGLDHRRRRLHARRRHRLARCASTAWPCDNLVGADVVTADGRLVHASADENPELFWGLRGGGGNFGVVTSFEFDAAPGRPDGLRRADLLPAASRRARSCCASTASWTRTPPTS